MIAQQRPVTSFHDNIETCTWIGPVTDVIAEADDVRDAALINIGEDGIQGLEIAVDIGNGRDAVGNGSAPCSTCLIGGYAK